MSLTVIEPIQSTVVDYHSPLEQLPLIKPKQKRTPLKAKWQVVDGKLICQWVLEDSLG